MPSRYTLTVHGARGSTPVWGHHYRRYSGNTSCFSLETRQGVILFDAGTGIHSIGRTLAARRRIPPITILFSHFHLDHLLGLPVFTPFMERRAKITLMADPTLSGNWRRTIKTIVGKPFWPVNPLGLGATIRLQDLPRAKAHARRTPAKERPSITCYGARISWCPTWHPQGSLSFRVEIDGTTIVLATDREQGHKRLDRSFLDFCRGVDILIHDAQNTPAEMPHHTGWGHSTWKDAARIASEVKAKRLVLTSHAPSRTDRELDAIVRAAKRIFPHTVGATDNMVLR